MSIVNARFCILLIVAPTVQSGAVKATSTPIEKVVTLLKDLATKLGAEGAREAAEYDKYACFCKEQADEKNYAMQKSRGKIKYWKAEIEELLTAKAELDRDISSLNRNVAKLAAKIEKKTGKRAKQHEKYLAVATDMNEAIEACKGAIESLKTSKKSMKGAKLDLTQVTSGLVQVVQRQSLLSAAPGAVALLAKLDDTKGAPKFQYQSNDIIATLEDLLRTFQKQKEQTDIDEFNTNSDFDKVKLGLSNDMKFAEAESADKATIAESKAEEIADSSGDKSAESDDLDADEIFLKRLSYECEEKAKLFDQRSGMRADELSALTKASAELESGAVPNFKASHQMSGLQLSAIGRKVERPISLVQINNAEHQASRSDEVLERVRSFLDDAADRTRSGALSAVAERVTLAAAGRAPDHYVKVRDLIKDLLQKLSDDALSESNQKESCDKGIKKATSERDEGHARIEAANAELVGKGGKKTSLEESNVLLTEQIADSKRAINEALELNVETCKTLDEQISLCDGGADSVKLALKVLESFYSTALVQVKAPPSHRVTSRDGETVGELAAESGGDTFHSTYHGAQAESGGIIGILEVVLDDFQKSSEKASEDRQFSVEGTQSFKEDCENDIKAKTKQRDDVNILEIASLAEKINEQENELREATGLLDSAMKALEGWHAMCIKGEETWEERTEKREREIAALKDALNILTDWQGNGGIPTYNKD